MDAEEFKRMEEGEEVEQQLLAAGEVEENLIEDILEDIVNPREKEAEKVDVSPAKQGVEGARAAEEEQPLPTTEEVGENLAENVSEVDKMDMDHSTLGVEKSGSMDVEENQNFEVNPTERVETGPVEGDETNVNAPAEEEIVILTDGEEKAEKVPPSIETVKPAAAIVYTYQRQPAREETSEKRSAGERPRETQGQRIGKNIESPAKSATGAPPRRRRLLFDEESEGEDDVFFYPIGEQHNQRQPDVHAGADDSDKIKERKEEKGESHCQPCEEEVETAINGCGYPREGPY